TFEVVEETHGDNCSRLRTARRVICVTERLSEQKRAFVSGSRRCFVKRRTRSLATPQNTFSTAALPQTSVQQRTKVRLPGHAKTLETQPYDPEPLSAMAGFHRPSVQAPSRTPPMPLQKPPPVIVRQPGSIDLSRCGHAVSTAREG